MLAGPASRFRLIALFLPILTLVFILNGFGQMTIASAASGGQQTQMRIPKSIHPHILKTQQALRRAVALRSQSRTHAPTDGLLYNGGPVMQTGTVTYAIFWEPATLQDSTSTSVSATYNSLLQSYFNDIGGSGLYNVNTQYYDNINGHIQNSSSFGGAWVDTSAYPASGCTDSATPGDCLTDAQIEAEVTNAMTANSWTGGLNHLFFVFTSKGEGSCFDSSSTACAFTDYCAYHSAFGSNNDPIVYANMPYTGTYLNACGVDSSPNNDFDADSTINVTSHEHMEATTDPLLNAWYDAEGEEIGDKCAWNFGSVNLDSNTANEHWNSDYYITQQEWSNALDGCTRGEQSDQLPGTLYRGAKDGSLYAINTSDSSLRWQYQTPSHKSITTAPVIASGVVYFGSSDRYVYAVNATTGSLLWHTKTNGTVESSPVIVSNVLYAGSDDGILYALNASNGSKLWSYQTHGAVIASPVVASNSVYVGSSNHTFYALNASNGSLQWKYMMHNAITGAAVVLNTTVYASSVDGYVYALSMSQGKLLWKYQIGAAVVGSLAASNSSLYAGSANGNLYALSTSQSKLLWKFHINSPVVSSPVVANNAVYVAANNYLYAINANQSQQLWRYYSSNGFSGNAATIDSAIYAGTLNGTVYALDPAHGSQLWQAHANNAWLSPAVEIAGY